MARRASSGEPHDWVTRAADDTMSQARSYGDAQRVITCASGASPSGPIHLGNLREFITPHFVVEEIRRHGVAVRHLHSWDDFDRFRKVPAGVDPSWAEHIGRPLSAVPDPWECHDSWAEHFKAPLRSALAEMGIEMQEVSQTEQYRAGAYTEQILHAIKNRDVIEEVLARHRTKKTEPRTPAPETEAAQGAEEAELLEDSVADQDDEPHGGGSLARFPYKPYCRQCGRDTVELTAYDDETTDLSYTCASCGFVGVTNVSTQHEGKLVWKVDWPMRWAYEGVDFEPGGLDHSTPGSSYTVGKELVERVFGSRAPSYVAYAFVGFAGVQKMSSSAGSVPTAADALKILEAPILRWLYARRQPKQAFDIDFGAEVVRLYDEWDALRRKVAGGKKRDIQVLAFERAAATSTSGVLPEPPVTAPFRLLSSVADITADSAEMISRIVGEAGYPHDSIEDLEPRLTKAITWMAEFVPTQERTTVRDAPHAERLATLSEIETLWLRELRARLPVELDLDSTTALLYGVPKIARGLGIDDPPTDQVKQDQKDFFRLLYNLLVDADRGPRLPTLFLALGSDKVHSLLGEPS